jgi:FlaA1/EpsC-like NDP-sugar epimerase
MADALLAGLAWWVADQIWFISGPNIIRITFWVLIASMVGSIFQVTSPLYRLTSIGDAKRLAFATAALLAIALGISYFPIQLSFFGPMDGNLALVASLLTGMFWATIRIARRVAFETPFRNLGILSRVPGPVHRTLLVGAGRAGSLIAQELALHPELGYRVVGFLDDAAEKQGARINGIQVLGTCSEIQAVVHDYKITHAVMAIPSASGRFIRKVVGDFQAQNVKVKTVPGLFNLLGAPTWKPDIQEISIEDVLRREPVHLDHGAMSEVAADKVVLITGAGGSIGSELARQMAALKPKSLVLLGRGENSLWKIERDLKSRFPDQSVTLELMDIRNRSGLREVFERYRPAIVLHTAAHKHVPFLETHPCEAVENNILGTLNVMEAALDFGTRRVINISTDKAVNPTNVLGASKRIAECIVLNAASKAAPGTQFASVRFGNVLGSRGSVVPIFKEQILAGGPITITHPAMTRYFMTIPEASQLVIQAALFGETGKVYILDMGEPVRILDLATDMAKLSGLVPGRDIQIEVVGLRPGEKIHEELFLEEERSSTSLHPKLLETNPQPLDTQVLEQSLEKLRAATHLGYEARQPEIVRLLKELVPTYKPSVLGVGRFGGFVRDRRSEALTLPPEKNRRRRA